MTSQGTVRDGGTAVPLTVTSKRRMPEPSSEATAPIVPLPRCQPGALSDPPATVVGGLRSSIVRWTERIHALACSLAGQPAAAQERVAAKPARPPSPRSRLKLSKPVASSRPVAILPVSPPSSSRNDSRASCPASLRSRASTPTPTIRPPSGADQEIRP